MTHKLTNAPLDVPVFNIVGANDEVGYGGGCRFWRTDDASKSISISGLGHNVQGAPETRAAIAVFLKGCRDYVPGNTTARLSVEETARELVSDMGDLATMEALMKANDAKTLSDDSGYDFWTKVGEAAFKLLTQLCVSQDRTFAP